jgi:short subunit dehydrogenase-like uncharacterized protein
MVAAMSERAYAVTLFGATGFTGGLAAHYLADHAPPGLRWAIAGRNKAKLESVRRELEGTHCPPSAVLEADASNTGALLEVARSTRVMASTVGPYIQYGLPVVRAAVAGGADYVDITGEPAFVAKTIDELDADAQREQLRIVSCCGFDSIPHDLGAQLCVETLRARGGADRPMRVEGFVRSRGTFSGGTWHSAIGAFSQLRKSMPKSERRGGPRRARQLPPKIRWVPELASWAMPLPTIDPAVVVRSANASSDYGPDFRYGHYARVKRLPTVIAGAAAVGSILALSQLGPTRALLLKVRQPGDGPSAEQRHKSWFEVTFLGTAGDAKATVTVRGGDPGYSETAKMISESALCLALDRDKLPSHYGVLTTAIAMGPVLRQRLVKAGISFDVAKSR